MGADDYIDKPFSPKLLALKITSLLKRRTEIIYLQSMQQQIKQENIPLKEFLHDEVCPLIRVEQDVTLKCEIDENFTLTFDRMALKNILVNLLHNATKHTSSGSITIKSFDNTVIIEDTGTGIDPKFSESIFDPFFCIDESKNREKSGFGLGLSIAKNLALNNGYTLSLDDSYVYGSRFILKSS